MQQLRDILKKVFPDQLPTWQPGDKAIAVMNYGIPQRLPQATDPQHINCPMCKGSSGYRVNDKSGYWWACTQQDCIQRNGDRFAQKTIR